MGERPRGEPLPTSTHHSMLESLLGSSTSAKESLIYSYGRSFNGFAAKLSDEEVETIKEMEGVVSVIPNNILELHTTRSWNFMGFSQSRLGASIEGHVIIGVFDSGIWPASPSFNDKNMTAPPAKWKGTCQGVNFTCNNKIIGVRYHISDRTVVSDSDIISPRDTFGHGSHTASIAAGREVPGASFYGLAEGTARGGVPNAGIAVYKVCWRKGCTTANILAAFDDAIADSVDIISVSLGSLGRVPYFDSGIAIGAFHAMRNGILISCSGGNYGPDPYSVTNYAPWMLTVAASTIDRKFVAQVVLGNGQVYPGRSVNSFNLNGTSYPLIWGGDAANYSAGFNRGTSRYCYNGAVKSNRAGGKIVLCDTFTDGSGVQLANGVGTIMSSSEFPDVARTLPLPATIISTDDGLQVLDYIRSAGNPTATILLGETWKDIMAPYIASFSSRGPNPITPDILKPDLTVPGVDILAGWSPAAPPSFLEGDKRIVYFNVVSGTSMSCPHASGAAACVKDAHPNWSPAAIKSALMTAAYAVDPKKHGDLEFAYGSGHINPLGAVHPGLVYHASEADYINFLCKQGYETSTLRHVTGDNSTICNNTNPTRGWDLNYPSFTLAVEDGKPINAIFTRTVTNVGLPNSTYTASWYNLPKFIRISVDPSVLSFSKIGEQKTYRVKLSGPEISQQPIQSSAIVWKDGHRAVGSPIVVFNVIPGLINPSYSTSHYSEKFKGPSMYRNLHN